MSDAIEAAAKALISAQRDMFRGGGWFALDDAKTLVSAALTAYEAAKGGGVGVKPLEWRNVDASPQSDDWWLEAVTPFGPYTVAFVEEHKLPWLLEPFRSNLDSNYATEDAAKAAAQADYEARIRSALTSPASGAEYRPTILGVRTRNNMRAEARKRLERQRREADVFIHVTPRADLCDHEWAGWRAFEDGRGGETFCQKCGLGAMSHSLAMEGKSHGQ